MSEMSPEDERTLAASLFNGTWTLLERDDRTRADDDRMLHMAHASRYHWGNVGTAANLARGEWMCSRVYTVLGRAEPAAAHARRVLQLCEENGLADFDLAFAYEALARAASVAGDTAEARRYVALAQAVPVADAEDRDLLARDLASIG
jgi:hypothetical protein